MSSWPAFLRKAKARIAALDAEGCDVPFFRGQPNSSWPLLPSLARHQLQNVRATGNPEEDLYFDFVTQAGALLPEGGSPWRVYSGVGG